MRDREVGKFAGDIEKLFKEFLFEKVVRYEFLSKRQRYVGGQH